MERVDGVFEEIIQLLKLRELSQFLILNADQVWSINLSIDLLKIHLSDDEEFYSSLVYQFPKDPLRLFD